MRRRPAMAWRSVDRGTRRPGIEPRKSTHSLRGADAVLEVEGNMMRTAKARSVSAPRGLRPCACVQAVRAETGRSHTWPRTAPRGPHRESQGNTTVMSGSGKSDRLIVPRKFSNNGHGAPRLAEGMEERGLVKENPNQLLRHRTQNRTEPRHALVRVRWVNTTSGSSAPNVRPVRQHPRQEPGAVVPHAGICPGAPRKGRPYRNRYTFLRADCEQIQKGRVSQSCSAR